MELNKSDKRKLVKSIKNLRRIWRYSDSQPTEIIMAVALILLAPVAIGVELGGLYIFRAILPIVGLYQLYCVSQEEINCRLRASMLSFGLYLASAIMYYTHIGFPTPTHYGWIIFVISSYGVMQRLILEKIHREKNG